jgi:hypothetical protein
LDKHKKDIAGCPFFSEERKEKRKGNGLKRVRFYTMKIFIFFKDMRLEKYTYEVRDLGQAAIGVPEKTG